MSTAVISALGLWRRRWVRHRSRRAVLLDQSDEFIHRPIEVRPGESEYDRHSYVAEKRAALELWESKLYRRKLASASGAAPKRQRTQKR